MSTTPQIDFTGEYFVPGKSDQRMAADHMERYKFACQAAEGMKVLDIACGEGYASKIFMQSGAASYQGIDINPSLIDHAVAQYATDNVSYSVGNICEFTCDVQFDLITCFETIEHVENFTAALARLYDALAKGGKLFISSPNRRVTSPDSVSLQSAPSNPYHTQEFLPDELIALLHEAGFHATTERLFGQRQGYDFSSKSLNALARLILGNPKKKASPVVQPVTTKVPRYFILVALKT